MAEMISMEDVRKSYATKGQGNLGVTLGAIGAGLGILNGGLGGLLGNRTDHHTNADSQHCAFVSKDTFWRQNVELEKELGVQRYDNLKANYDLYITLDNKISALQSKNAQLEASLPLAFELSKCQSERYADNKVYGSVSHQSHINFEFQREIDKKVNGYNGLPWSSIISGVPTMPNCTVDVTCPK